MPILIFSLLVLSYAPISLTITPHRHLLHQPLSPISPLSDDLPPTEPPDTSPPIPKFPTSTNSPPFFPLDPSPPSPPSSSSTTLPTFPANISSLILPKTSAKKSNSPKLLFAVLLPVLLLLIFAGFAFYFFARRRRRSFAKDGPKSDSHRLFPANVASSNNHRKVGVSATPSEFLYLGTLVNSRRVDSDSDSVPPAVNSPYRKLGSPELHPLPPLPRQFRRNNGNGTDPGSSEEEEFYSPRGSSAEKESPGTSRRVFPVTETEKSGSPITKSDTPSYSFSNSASSPRLSSRDGFRLQIPKLDSPGSSSSSRTSSLSGSSPRVRFSSVVPKLDSPGSSSRTASLPSKTPSPAARLSPERGKIDSPDPQFPRGQEPPPPPQFSRDPPPPPPLFPPQFSLAERDQAKKAPGEKAAGPPNRPPPPPPPPPPAAGFCGNQVGQAPPQHILSRPPVLITPRNVEFDEKPSVSDMNCVNLESLDTNEENPRLKLKPLHWDKVRASSDRAMVWDQLKSSSFQLNEKMIETLFVYDPTNGNPREMARRAVLPSPNQENRVLDPKKSQNIAILLRALNVTKEEVCEALLEGHIDGLGTELLETLMKMAPTKEEEHKLKDYKDDSPFKLGPAEKFLKAVIDIPFAFKRVDAMLYIANFDSEVKYLGKSFETLEAACEELRNSRMFLKLLDAVLKTGNRMNVGTNRGDAHAFKLDTLLKLVDVKGTDGKTTLLHFVVQEITRSEGSRLSSSTQSPIKTNQSSLQNEVEFRKLGLQVVSGLGGELTNVKKAATMDSDVLSSYVSKLAGGIGKISEVLRLNEPLGRTESSQKFSQSMIEFLKKAEEEIIRIQAQESVALSLVKEITEYFHGNSAKEEAHPFRIFLVVRDFLSTLDQVCKEVGKFNERTIMSSARPFPVPVNPTLPVFPRFHVQRFDNSDDDDSS